MSVSVCCAKCGHWMPIKDSAEWPLIQRGAFVEFHYCTDDAACLARIEAKNQRSKIAQRYTDQFDQFKPQ